MSTPTPSKRPASQASSDPPTPSRRGRSSQQVVVPETPQRSTDTPTQDGTPRTPRRTPSSPKTPRTRGTPRTPRDNIPGTSPARALASSPIGSDDDSDEDNIDEDMEMFPTFVPRSARLFMSEHDDDEEMEYPPDANMCFEWPLQLSQQIDNVQMEVEVVDDLLIIPIESPNVPEPTDPLAAAPVEHTDVLLTIPAEPIVVRSTLPEFEPTNKFNFTWSPFPKHQTEPVSRREPFSNIECGPTISLTSPYEAFTAIWNRNIMNHIAKETNRYAQQLATRMMSSGTLQPTSRINKWVDTDVDELYVYLAVVLAIGIVVKSRVEDYWNKSDDIFSTPGFTASMRYDRFVLLSRCLHFQNNDSLNLEQMTRPEARLFKLRPIIKHLNRRFSQLYNMSRNVSLHESLTMWKGWININQFIPNKAASVGIKTYEVCESETGYLWRFEVHAGYDTSAQQQSDPLSGIVPSTVLRMLEGLENRGHTIWMDHYYSSPALARELKIRGFDCVGTLRTNRQLVPDELKNLKIQDMAVGQVSGCTSGDVDLLVWRDKRRVALISTYHGLSIVKCGDRLMPSIVPDYNVSMRGVDRKDQMLTMYPIERRQKVWYKKLFRRLVNASTLNAYILLKAQKPIDHRNFRKTLVQELLSKHIYSVMYDPMPIEGHFPALYDHLRAGEHGRKRKYCAFCKKRTISYCKACKVPLCTYTCFQPHHSGCGRGVTSISKTSQSESCIRILFLDSVTSH